jgi:hypothetical protein
MMCQAVEPHKRDKRQRMNRSNFVGLLGAAMLVCTRGRGRVGVGSGSGGSGGGAGKFGGSTCGGDGNGMDGGDRVAQNIGRL